MPAADHFGGRQTVKDGRIDKGYSCLLYTSKKLMSSDKSNQLLIREAIRKIALGRSMERINLAPGGMSGIGTARIDVYKRQRPGRRKTGCSRYFPYWVVSNVLLSFLSTCREAYHPKDSHLPFRCHMLRRPS